MRRVGLRGGSGRDEVEAGEVEVVGGEGGDAGEVGAGGGSGHRRHVGPVGGLPAVGVGGGAVQLDVDVDRQLGVVEDAHEHRVVARRLELVAFAQVEQVVEGGVRVGGDDVGRRHHQDVGAAAAP